jgi:hypothetical protein
MPLRVGGQPVGTRTTLKPSKMILRVLLAENKEDRSVYTTVKLPNEIKQVGAGRRIIHAARNMVGSAKSGLGKFILIRFIFYNFS